MNVALMQQMHSRSSADLIGDLVGAIDALPGAANSIARLVADRDRLAAERLERLSEQLEGIRRQALLARQALVNEAHGPAAA